MLATRNASPLTRVGTCVMADTTTAVLDPSRRGDVAVLPWETKCGAKPKPGSVAEVQSKLIQKSELIHLRDRVHALELLVIRFRAQASFDNDMISRCVMVVSAGCGEVSSTAHGTEANAIANLTPRQRHIMDLVVAGHPSKNIAADLGLSQRTVENHRAAIMKKTGSTSLPALGRLALVAELARAN